MKDVLILTVLRLPEKYRITNETQIKGGKQRGITITKQMLSKKGDAFGLFAIPRQGAKSGQYYFVYVTEGDKQSSLQAGNVADKKPLTLQELSYIRSMFVIPESVVTMHIKNIHANEQADYDVSLLFASHYTGNKIVETKPEL